MFLPGRPWLLCGHIDQKCSGRINMFLGCRYHVMNIFNDTQVKLIFHQIEYK